MIELWSAMALLTLVAIALVFWPLLRAGRQARREPLAEDRQHQNIEIFRERLAELEQERSAGTLDRDNFELLKLELERNLLIDADTSVEAVAPPVARPVTSAQLVTVVLLALLVPVGALGLYSHLGGSAELARAMNPPPKPTTLEQALSQLEQELKHNPENPEGWYLLGTTYMGQGRYDEGLAAFIRVSELLPPGSPQYAGVQGQIAQAMYFLAEGQMNEEIRAQINRTLSIDPQEIAALGLLGIDAFENGEYAAAMQYWHRALPGASGDAAQSLRNGIERARQQLVDAGQPVPELEPVALAGVSLNISLAPELRERVRDDQTVFVFARPVGERMPLAALRVRVGELPISVRLDDSQAMMPGRTLSAADEVEVGALISQTGSAAAQAGDLIGTQAPVAVDVDAPPLELVIDRVVE